MKIINLHQRIPMVDNVHGSAWVSDDDKLVSV
jgi:hypothetical protein